MVVGFLFREDLLECLKSFIKDKAMLSSFRAVSCANTNSYSLVGVLDHSVNGWGKKKFPTFNI